MARFLKNQDAAIGNAPEDAIFIGKKRVEKIDITVLDYDSEHLEEKNIEILTDIIKFRESAAVTWININGLHEASLIKEIGQLFKLHSLTIEDILNTGLRPKMEEYDHYLFFMFKKIHYNDQLKRLEGEQLSLILGDNFVLTFQERPSEIFELVKNRIRKQKGKIRKNGADYLAYSLLDAIVENYINIISKLGEKIEEIESKILTNPNHQLLMKIYAYKQEINYIRKSVRPTKDFILHLSRMDNEFFEEFTRPFLKDLLDLAIQAVEVVDVYREILSDHLNFYNSRMNNKLNEIMKVLTIFSVIFIPLTFIASIYGTNFDYLPELRYKYGYFVFLGALVMIATSMLIYFKKKKWL